MAKRSDRQPDDQDSVVASPAALGGSTPGGAAEDRIFAVAGAEPPVSTGLREAVADSMPRPGPADAPRRRQIPTIPHPRGRGLSPSPAVRAMPQISGASRRVAAAAEPDRYFESGSPVEPGTIQPGPAGAPDRVVRPRRLWLLGAAVAAVALLASGVLWSTRDRDAAESRQSALSESATMAGNASQVPPSAESASPRVTRVPAAPLGGSTKASTAKPAQTALANPAGVDLALNRTVRASGSQGPGWSPAYAVDGKLSTRWSSAFSDPQWISIDLGVQRQISVVRLSWEHAYATAYRVQVSPDGHAWKSVYSTARGQGGEVTIRTDKVAGRYVRVYGTERSTQYGYSLFEIDIR